MHAARAGLQASLLSAPSMPTVSHVVVTREFAGVERYVCTTAQELAVRGWDVFVVGGNPLRMPHALKNRVQWLPGERRARR